MNCPKCQTEMRDMGHWPNPEGTAVVNRWHCQACNEYTSEPVPGIKLVPTPDGGLAEVPI
jgi:transcriptional regulator NrdR family protein